MRVLVIEDDAQTAAYMVKGLSEAGHTVDHAPNGRDGLFLQLGLGLAGRRHDTRFRSCLHRASDTPLL